LLREEERRFLNSIRGKERKMGGFLGGGASSIGGREGHEGRNAFFLSEGEGLLCLLNKGKGRHGVYHSGRGGDFSSFQKRMFPKEKGCSLSLKER